MMGWFVKLSLPMLGLYWLALLLCLVLWRHRLPVPGQLTFVSVRRPSAQSCELKLREHHIKLTLWGLVLAFVPVYTLVVLARLRSPATIYAFGALGLFVTILAIARAWHHMSRIHRLRLDREGRVMMARYLDEHASREQEVFHDYGTDGERIDHVLVGPGGVYAVSTLMQTGACRIGSDDRPRLVIDGLELIRESGERHRDTTSLRSASQKAGRLHNYIATRGGGYVTIQPVVLLPGCDIEFERAGCVTVLNERQLQQLFQGKRELQPSSLRRIVVVLDRSGRLGAVDVEQLPAQAPAVDRVTSMHG